MIHRSKTTKADRHNHPEILIEERSAWTPELNPEEECQGNVKPGLKNARPTGNQEMRSRLDRGLAGLRQ